mmetsp:Transcript_31454/g.74764  ORF Transcript_31454/g.74764 Transcript_31454/m.74764 type:complete len:259 (-) Transcript_31454:1445-2221(-)
MRPAPRAVEERLDLGTLLREVVQSLPRATGLVRCQLLLLLRLWYHHLDEQREDSRAGLVRGGDRVHLRRYHLGRGARDVAVLGVDAHACGERRRYRVGEGPGAHHGLDPVVRRRQTLGVAKHGPALALVELQVRGRLEHLNGDRKGGEAGHVRRCDRVRRLRELERGRACQGSCRLVQPEAVGKLRLRREGARGTASHLRNRHLFDSEVTLADKRGRGVGKRGGRRDHGHHHNGLHDARGRRSLDRHQHQSARLSGGP